MIFFPVQNKGIFKMDNVDNVDNVGNGIKLKQFDILLNEETGELYYKGNRFEIRKEGNEYWHYGVYLDGNRIENICGIDFCIRVGELPIISVEIIDQ